MHMDICELVFGICVLECVCMCAWWRGYPCAVQIYACWGSSEGKWAWILCIIVNVNV